MRRKQYLTLPSGVTELGKTFDALRWNEIADEIERRYGWSDIDKYGVEPSQSILEGLSWRVCPNTVDDKLIRYKDTLWTQVTDMHGNYLANWTREIAERQRAEEIHKASGTLAEIREADVNDMDEDNDGKTLDWLFE